jgi:hypothetical protein
MAPPPAVPTPGPAVAASPTPDPSWPDPDPEWTDILPWPDDPAPETSLEQAVEPAQESPPEESVEPARETSPEESVELVEPVEPQPEQIRYPIPPAAHSNAPDPNLAFGAPATALRMAWPLTPNAQSGTDLVIDPMSLRGRLRLHAGVTTMTIDERSLTLRTRFKRTRIPWTDVLGFQPQYDVVGADGVTNGSVVVVTTTGPVVLQATRGSLGDVRYAQAMLEAYRIRAQLVLNT